MRADVSITKKTTSGYYGLLQVSGRNDARSFEANVASLKTY